MAFFLFPWMFRFLKEATHSLPSFPTFYSVSNHSSLLCLSFTSLTLFVQIQCLCFCSHLTQLPGSVHMVDHFLFWERIFYLHFHDVTLFWLSSCLTNTSVLFLICQLFPLTQTLHVGDLQGFIHPVCLLDIFSKKWPHSILRLLTLYVEEISTLVSLPQISLSQWLKHSNHLLDLCLWKNLSHPRLNRVFMLTDFQSFTAPSSL